MQRRAARPLKSTLRRICVSLALLIVSLWLYLGAVVYQDVIAPLTVESTATSLPTPRQPSALAIARPSASPTSTPSPIPTQSPTPTNTAAPTDTRIPSATPTPTFKPTTRLPALTPTRRPTLTPTPSPTHFVMLPQQPGGNHPTLADFWEGRAQFVVENIDTGLPMGESDAIIMRNGEVWAYLHASQRSAGALDRCGNPVDFPGCTVIYRSYDGGRTFQHDSPPTCQFECEQCPCDSKGDHIDQQQYPRLAYNGKILFLVYEYRARVMLRRSSDGLTWSAPEELLPGGVWTKCPANHRPEERIGPHPYALTEYACLIGGPPGVYVEGNRLYVFVGLGQNPGSMGCYYGQAGLHARFLRKCKNNPLFTGAIEYGPLEEKGPQTNAFFDFRMISSAEVQKVGDRYYMLYEGIRGPGPGDPGDSQFGLGLARSLTGQIDSPWEKFPGNPILADQPGNIGVGHADLLVIDGQTVLYTSLNGITRSRLVLAWK